jgi:site-specific DNA recombinase
MPTDDRRLQGVPVKRVAIYARYSSDLQRPSSIEDQIRQCREAAARNGWVVVDDYIRSDAAVSGRSLVGRKGLDQLVTLAEQTPRPFDGILIDDTSRFGRNLSDTLPMSDILENASVFLYFGNCSLDSRDPNFRLLFIAYGQQDEQYSRHLGELVHRGQKGRVLKGYLGSGRVYGYTNVPIEDPTRKGLYGRPYVEAVKLEINHEEAAVVMRIFEMYVQGLGRRAMATKLNEDRIASPLKGQSLRRRLWNTVAISGILTNEKYRGVHIWNRTKTIRNPRTHRKEQRTRPETEWERVEVPEWRIVSDALWNAAAEVKQKRQATNWRKTGGLNRTAASRRYIFSDTMICAECGGKFNVVGGKGEHARYGCFGHRAHGICRNKLTISRQMLESRLLHALSLNIQDLEFREHLVMEFRIQLTKAWKQMNRKAEKSQTSVKSLQGKQDHLRHQAENLLDALAATKGSSLVVERLNAIEAQITNIDALLAAQPKGKVAPPSVEDLHKFLGRKLCDMESIFAGNPEMAKQRILKHVGKLVMGPMYPPEGPAYEIGGDVRLFVGPDNDTAASGLIRSAGPVLIKNGFRGSAAA